MFSVYNEQTSVLGSHLDQKPDMKDNKGRKWPSATPCLTSYGSRMSLLLNIFFFLPNVSLENEYANLCSSFYRLDPMSRGNKKWVYFFFTLIAVHHFPDPV